MTIPEESSNIPAHYSIARNPTTQESDVQIHNVTKKQQNMIYQQLSLLHISDTPQSPRFNQETDCVIIHVTNPQDEESVCKILERERIRKATQSPLQKKLDKLQEQLNTVIPILLKEGFKEELAKIDNKGIPLQVAQDLTRTTIGVEITYTNHQKEKVLDKDSKELLSEEVVQLECEKGKTHQLAMLAWTQVVRNPGALIELTLKTELLNQHGIASKLMPSTSPGIGHTITIQDLPFTDKGHPQLSLKFKDQWGLQTSDNQTPLARGTTLYECTLVLNVDKVEVQDFHVKSDLSLAKVTEENKDLIKAVQSTFLTLEIPHT